jgi:hypothetical protein
MEDGTTTTKKQCGVFFKQRDVPLKLLDHPKKMVSRFERDLTTIIASTVKITEFNKDDDLPFQLVCSQNDKLTWTCNYDEQKHITSVFDFKGNQEEEPGREVRYLDDVEQALKFRNELIRNGWVFTKVPKTTISYPGMEKLTVGEVKLNRRQKRQMPTMLNKLSNEKDHHNVSKEKGKKLSEKWQAKHSQEKDQESPTRPENNHTQRDNTTVVALPDTSLQHIPKNRRKKWAKKQNANQDQSDKKQ